MGLLNRIIIEDLLLKDKTGKEMLKVARLSAKFDILPLFKGKISISNVQLFGFNINLEKERPDSRLNFQFVLDAFASKDTVQKNNALDLRINSLLIRRGKLSYNVLSAQDTPGKFNPQHILLQNIIANISLKALRNDSINAAIKRMSIEEANSGFELNRLSFKMLGDNKSMNIEGFQIELPHTALSMDTIHLRYDSLNAFKNFADDVDFDLRILPSKITLQDLSPFVPAFKNFKEELQAEINIKGNLNNLECPHIAISSDKHFLLNGNLSLQNLTHPHDALIYGHLSNLYADADGMNFFTRNFNQKGLNLAPIFKNMKFVSFQGEISGYFTDLVTYGQIRTDLGTIHSDLKLALNKDQNNLSYSGSIKTKDFKLGTMMGNNKVGKITLDLKVNGNHRNQRYPSVNMQGLIASAEYSGYTYENISLDGKYEQGGFNGFIALDDPNISLQLNGNVNAAEKIPTFKFNANISHFRPNALQLTQNYKETEFDFKIKADFTGGSIDEMKGEINVDSLLFTAPDKSYFMDNLKLTATQKDEHHKNLSITSKFLKAGIEGDYSYRTLPTSVLNIMHKYIPALVPAKATTVNTENNFYFDVHLFDADLFSTIFQIPIKLYTHSTLKGYFNDKTQRLRLEGYFPRLRYEDKFIESGMILCENPNGLFHTRIRFSNRKANGAVNLAIDAKAKDNRIQTILNWGNSSKVTYSGQLSTTLQFVRKQISPESQNKRKRSKQKTTKTKPSLTTIVDLQPTNMIVNDTLWEIHPSQIVIDSGKVHIKDFYFSHEERYLRINGVLSDAPQDTVYLDLNKINIGYVFDIAALNVNFRGEATGRAYASGVLKQPFMSTDLHIHNFGLNDGLLGDANIHGEWHHDIKGIYLDAHIQEQEIAKSHVYGFIYPLKPTSSLDLQIEAHNTNLKFVHYYMSSITPEFNGRVSGNVHFYGKFKELTMAGRVTGDASMKVEVLNTTFSLKDSILITPDGLTFNNNRIYDTQGHEGRMSGELRYEHFKNLRYRFNFSVNNMLVMNTRESFDYPFYGTIYATGNASISGNQLDGVNIDVAMTTNRNSTFTYIKDYISTATSNQFIKFIDKTPRRVAIQDSLFLSAYEQAQREITEEEEEEGETDIHLNLLVDATPDATMRIIMDPIAGDYISGKGSGNIRTEFYNKGDVKMFGNYRINQGIYKFSLQEVIRKDFIIKDGSSITFNGSPLDAILDITASYTVNSASLNDLISNASAYVDQTNVKVNCIMNLTGQLTSPDIKMELELPNERDEVQALVRNYIPTDEQMNMQILYLLSIGKFSPENADANQNSDMMSSVLSSTLSGQLNNALSHIINSNNWNFGTNFSTGEKGWTDVEFETMLSGQLLNNRLLINGNFGYRDNPLANTNFVGDFDAEWLVTRSGDIRLKAYNETNDRYYTKTNLTTQGIGIIFKKEFNKWNELLFWNSLKRKKKSKAENDSTALPAIAPAQSKIKREGK